MMAALIAKIISGGQTGADRATAGIKELRRRELNRPPFSAWFGKTLLSFGLRKSFANLTEPHHAQKRFFVSVIVSK